MFSRKLTAVVISAVSLAMPICGTVEAGLVTNGGFESYTGTAPKAFLSNVAPIDWSGGGYAFVDSPGSADDPLNLGGPPVWPTFPNTSPQGGNFVQADGSAGLNQPLTQTITGLTAGQSYTVSFYQAAGQQLADTGATTEQWQVTLGSDTQMSALMNDPSMGVIPWQAQTLTLTADNSTDVLSFLAIGSGGLPPYVFLDGVDMESAVPEPSALFLLAVIGSGAVIGRLRRRVRVKSDAV